MKERTFIIALDSSREVMIMLQQDVPGRKVQVLFQAAIFCACHA